MAIAVFPVPLCQSVASRNLLDYRPAEPMLACQSGLCKPPSVPRACSSRNTVCLTPHTVGRTPRPSLPIGSFVRGYASQPASLRLGCRLFSSVLNLTPFVNGCEQGSILLWLTRVPRSPVASPRGNSHKQEFEIIARQTLLPNHSLRSF